MNQFKRYMSYTDDTGATVVEAALVFPVLLLILFGIIQWGLIFAAQVTLRASAASTVREFAVIGTTDCATLRTVAGLSAAPLLHLSNLDLNTQQWNPTPGNPMRRISLGYNFNVLLPFVVPNSSGGSVRLSADAAMRCEQNCAVVPPANCP